MIKKIVLIITMTLALVGCVGASNVKNPPRKVAAQAYTFRNFTFEEMLPLLRDSGLTAVECYPGQLLSKKYPSVMVGPNMNAQQRAYMKKLLNDNGINMVSYGVTTPKNEKDIKATCEFVSEMGAKNVITESQFNSLKSWEKYSKECGINVGLHNHAIDSWNQYYRPEVVSDLTDRFNIYACPDVGHWARSGLDPVWCLRKLEGKIKYCIHFKDLNKVGELKNCKGVAYGTGAMDVKGMLSELDRQGFNGYFVIENEQIADDPLPTVKKCVEYLSTH